MADIGALREHAVRLGLELDDDDLARIAVLLEQTRESVRSLGPLATEWIEPGYVFTPIPAAPRDADTPPGDPPHPATDRPRPA